MEISENTINEIIDKVDDLIEMIESAEEWEMCLIIHKIRKEIEPYSHREQKRKIAIDELLSQFENIFQSKESINIKQLK